MEKVCVVWRFGYRRNEKKSWDAEREEKKSTRFSAKRYGFKKH